jgi:hypothetical protein
MFERMQAAARTRGVPMLAVIIPTKETVLWPQIERHPELPSRDLLRRLAEAEARVDGRVREAFDALGLPYVSVLPGLREAVGSGEEVYPFGDGHPNPKGCEVIAKAVRAALEDLGPVPVVAAR